MPLVLRVIGLESGILVQKFAVRQGSVGRCNHSPQKKFLFLCKGVFVSPRRDEGIAPYRVFYCSPRISK